MVEVCDLKAGDMVAHHSECVHLARENTSPSVASAAGGGRTRWAFASVFNGVDCTVNQERFAVYIQSAVSQGSGTLPKDMQKLEL